MKSKFTPGPWKFPFQQTPEQVETLTVPPESDSQHGKGWISKTIYVANANDECLAEVKAYTTKGFLQDFEQWEGNAKLIVSAPDLLAALKAIVEWEPSKHILPDSFLKNAHAAINKATL